MKALFKALSDFQKEVPIIYKENTAGSGNFAYKYADLPTIIEAINPILAKHNLGFTQTVNGTQLCTTIFHTVSGEMIEGCADIPQGIELKGMNAFQVLGSAITYMRRYQLSSMLGLVTDKDTDAQGEQVATTPNTDNKPWLNPKTDAWNKAVEYLVGGGIISKIEDKYKLSKDNRQALMDAALES